MNTRRFALSLSTFALLAAIPVVAAAQPAPRPATRPAPGVRPAPAVPAAPASATPAPAAPAPAAAPAAAPAPTAPAPAAPTPAVPAPAAAVAQPAPADPAAAVAQPAPQPQGPRTAVVDAAPIGVDPAAAQFVTGVLRAAIGAAGFSVIPTPELHEAARRIQLPFPVPEEGLVMLERALQAPVGATAEVRAASGLYVVRLRVRVASERRERVRDVAASQFQLEDVIRAALPQLLVPPSADGEPPMASTPPDVMPGVGPAQPPESAGVTPPVATPPARPRRRVRAHPRTWELSVGGLVALGPGQDSFVNGLGAVRAGWFPHDRFGVTATVAYANLNGREGRVSNVFFAAGIETAVDLVPSAKVFIPLRAEVGYLPLNGPVFRVTAGVAFQVARRVRIEVDLLSPTLWVLPESTPVSLDLGAFVHFGL